MHRLRIAAAAVLLLALVQTTTAVNGGSGCKLYFRPKILAALQARNITDPATIFKALSSTLFVNSYLCKSCRGPANVLKNKGLVDPKLGECWCAPGYGYSRLVKPNGKILQRFGCSKCIKETPNSNATTGPYDPVARTFSATKCTV